MFDYFPSTKQVARNLWKQIDVWLNIKIIRLQITILIDFGDFLLIGNAMGDREPVSLCRITTALVHSDGNANHGSAISSRIFYLHL